LAGFEKALDSLVDFNPWLDLNRGQDFRQ
jgi:hypothetical protein